MKLSTRAIIILSVLLAASLGWIIYSQIAGSRDLRDALERVRAAGDLNRALLAGNVTLKKDNAELEAEGKAQRATIAAQSGTIASLKASQAKKVELSQAVVDAGADLRTAFDAGSPLVVQVGAQPLSDWYRIVDGKITVVLDDSAALHARIGSDAGYISTLEGQNADLLAGRDRSDALIFSQGQTITSQGARIDAQDLALTGATTKIASALGRAQAGEFFAWLFAGLFAAAATDDLGHRLGWWK